MIPKLFHQVWLGGELPERFVPFVASWRRLHPEWDYLLWRDDILPELQNQELFDRAHELAPGFEGQFKADVLRYELLYMYGGVYVDVDMEAIRPIDELLVRCEPEVFVGYEVEHHWINNAVMGARSLHPFIFQLIENLPANVARRAGRRPNWLSGPKYVTPQLRQYESRGARDVHVFPQQYFYPYAYNELERAGERFEGSYAVHHWDNQRKLRGVPL